MSIAFQDLPSIIQVYLPILFNLDCRIVLINIPIESERNMIVIVIVIVRETFHLQIFEIEPQVHIPPL